MHVSVLMSYPIKACAGISLREAELVRTGIRADRRWMLVGDDGRFVSQRQVAALALVGTAFDNDAIVVFSAGMAELRIPLVHADEAAVPVRIWNDECRALPHAAGSAWFSRYLGQSVQLVYMPDSSERRVDPSRARPTDIVSFADAFPLLVISEASLDDLNRRLTVPVPMNRFRPNVVVAGAEPYAEEAWARFSIGSQSLRGVKPCGRCVVTTIDQATGEGGVEPLKTLATYKRGSQGSVVFGMNVIHDGPGRIRVGDPVEVHEMAR